jgi:hypothetical protein
MVSNSVPVGQRDAYLVCHLWVMYVSSSYFRRLKTSSLVPVYAPNASATVDPALPSMKFAVQTTLAYLVCLAVGCVGAPDQRSGTPIDPNRCTFERIEALGLRLQASTVTVPANKAGECFDDIAATLDCLAKSIKLVEKPASTQKLLCSCMQYLVGGEPKTPLLLEVKLARFSHSQALRFPLSSDEFKSQRFTNSWFICHTWRRLRAMKIEGFDFSKKPMVNVAPPDATGARAGTSPGSIQDPILREKYEQDIRSNAVYAESFVLQRDLQRLDGEFSIAAVRYLQEVYTQPPLSTIEFASLTEGNYLLANELNELRNLIR